MPPGLPTPPETTNYSEFIVMFVIVYVAYLAGHVVFKQLPALISKLSDVTSSIRDGFAGTHDRLDTLEERLDDLQERVP